MASNRDACALGELRGHGRDGQLARSAAGGRSEPSIRGLGGGVQTTPAELRHGPAKARDGGGGDPPHPATAGGRLGAARPPLGDGGGTPPVRAWISGGRGGSTPPPRELRRKVSSPGNPGQSGRGSPATPPAEGPEGPGEWETTAPPSLVRLQATARAVAERSGLGSMAWCGTTPITSEVAYVVDSATGKRGGVSGVGRCGQAGCPKCDSIEARERAEEIEHAIAWWQGHGGNVFHVIKTVPHSRHDDPRELRVALAEAQKRMYQGRSWMELREAWSLARGEHGRERMHYTRSFEVTYGDNGSHPHVHELLFVGGDVQLADVLREMRVRWAEASEATLGRTPHERIGVLARRVEDTAEDRAIVSRYVSKTGNDVAWEVAGGALKLGFAGDDGGDDRKGTTPARMLWLASRGDAHAESRWVDHVRAWKGARRFSWSKGFRQLVGEYEEKAPEATRPVLMVPAASHRTIARNPHAFALVVAALANGRAAALRAIAEHVDPYVADFVDVHSRSYASDAARRSIDVLACVDESSMSDRARALDRVEREAWNRHARRVAEDESSAERFDAFTAAMKAARAELHEITSTPSA